MTTDRGIYLFLTIFLSAGTASAKEVQQVNVINTPTVNVGNSVTVDNVDLPVTIRNDTSNPVPVQSAEGGVRVQYALGGSFEVGNITLTPRDDFDVPLSITVPQGKKLHVKEVACSASMPSGQTGQLAILGEVITPDGSTHAVRMIPVNLVEQSVSANGFFKQLSVYQLTDTVVDDSVTTSPELTLWGLRSGDTLSTGVSCRVGGVLSDL